MRYLLLLLFLVVPTVAYKPRGVIVDFSRPITWIEVSEDFGVVRFNQLPARYLGSFSPRKTSDPRYVVAVSRTDGAVEYETIEIVGDDGYGENVHWILVNDVMVENSTEKYYFTDYVVNGLIRKSDKVPLNRAPR